MMEKCTGKITEWLIKCDAIQEEDCKLYEYAMYSILLTLSPILLALVVGVLLGATQQGILIIIPFVILRKFSGGYHAKSAGVCFISSSLLLVLCIFLSFIVECDWRLWGVTALSAISLIYFSPIENENRLLNKKEWACYKKIVTAIVICFIIADLFLFLFKLDTYAICISIGIVLAAGLQLPCMLER